MRIAIDRFRGEAPRVAPQNLPAGMAQDATNARLLSGDLEAWKGTQTEIASLAKPGASPVVTIFPLDVDEDAGGPFWLHWREDELAAGADAVDVARSLVVTDIADDVERFYFAGTGTPKFCNLALATGDPDGAPVGAYPYAWLELGVGGPDDPPDVEVEGSEAPQSSAAITNPGAETGDTTGWTTNVGALAAQQSGGGLTAPQGDWFFYGGDAVAETEADQALSLSSAGLVPGGQFTLSWQQATGAAGSQARMGLRFFDSTGTEIGAGVYSPLYAPASADTFEARTLAGQIPDDARTLRIVMNFVRTGAGDNDAYIDAIDLVAEAVTFSSDGSTLSEWQVELSPAQVAIEIEDDPPFGPAPGQPPVIQWRIVDRARQGTIYRSMAAKDSPEVVIRFDAYPHRHHLLVHVGSDRRGTGTVLELTYDRLRLRSCSDWLDYGGLLRELEIADLPPGIGESIAYAVTLRLTPTEPGYSNLEYTVVRRDTKEAVYVGEEEVAIVGGHIGFAYRRTEDDNAFGVAANTWLDNIFLRVDPPPKPVADGGAGGGGTGSGTTSTSYVYTFVNEDGSESAPSAPSEPINRGAAATVTVTTATAADNPDVVGKRIYRAVTGAEGTQYLLVNTEGDIPLAQAEYTDNKRDAQLGEPIDTLEFETPPADLRNLVAAANGITYGSSGNQVCPSATNRPYAYPVGIRLATDYPIVALAIMDTDLVVLTQAHPYIVAGDDPAALTMAKLEKPQGCASKRSVATVEGLGVVYASPDGLTAVSRGRVEVITRGLFSRREWQALGPQQHPRGCSRWPLLLLARRQHAGRLHPRRGAGRLRPGADQHLLHRGVQRPADRHAVHGGRQQPGGLGPQCGRADRLHLAQQAL